MAKPATEQKWYQERSWSTVIVIAGLAISYVFASLAINSGSLIQYFVAAFFLGLAVNRATHVIVVSVTGKPHNG